MVRSEVQTVGERKDSKLMDIEDAVVAIHSVGRRNAENGRRRAYQVMTMGVGPYSTPRVELLGHGLSLAVLYPHLVRAIWIDPW